jgi:hypothetical protein
MSQLPNLHSGFGLGLGLDLGLGLGLGLGLRFLPLRMSQLPDLRGKDPALRRGYFFFILKNNNKFQ